MFLTATGNVEMVNCRALKMEMTVKAWVVSNSTPARVIVRKRKKGAMMEVDGLSKLNLFKLMLRLRSKGLNSVKW